MASAEHIRSSGGERSGSLRALKAVTGFMMALALLTNALIILQGTFQPVREVEGLSMSPSINPDDGLLVVPVKADEIEPGQVVVFPDPQGFGSEVVHRVVGVERSGGEIYLTTKGDNNPAADPLPVPAEAVRGRVALRLPAFGLFMDFARSPVGFSLCVLSPLLLFFFCCAAETLQDEGRRGGALGRWLAAPIARR